MNRRDLLGLMGCGVLSSVYPFPTMAQNERKPNVVAIISDGAGYAHFGYHGCPDIPTLRIDQ